MSRRPPAAAVPEAGGTAPEPAAVAPEVGGTAVEGGSAAAAAALTLVVVGALVTGVQPATDGRLRLALVEATETVNGWMISVNTLLFEAASGGNRSISAQVKCQDTECLWFRWESMVLLGVICQNGPKRNHKIQMHSEFFEIPSMALLVAYADMGVWQSIYHPSS